MVGRDGAFGLLMGAAIVFYFLFPAQGAAQDSLSGSCAEVTFPSPLEDLTRCAEEGYAGAQHLLGLRYEIGHDAPQDDAEAFLWYRQAAEQGHSNAQSDLGMQYAKGGVLQNLVYAYMWLGLSAAQGNEGASFNKEMLEQRMTGEQIAEAERLSREWIGTHP
jgi:TPR repeat protein